ncbi:sarcolemmal membrane-associated protein [Galendromus occidentalis]|uniref:Sarcolemmal membrane-associated protein n=1 Tax=Galendromus occidentalis TaxID=34638 RepID=A0AAJ6QVE3_9ACAR|nr:sarcolemmal membrane-associated protein [Galendromus occidentalis]
MARDSLDMSGSDSDSSILDSIPDGSVRLASNFQGPTIHLLWRATSHKFEDRIIPLSKPAKVGRSVAKLKPCPHNAIFDCKVLSRNHAMIWFENDKFYIQDTQSSNGTFVNNERLSKGSEESLRREIYSGDVLQFGVDVIENSKKVTHGCIIALAKLFLADGTEVKAENGSSDRALSKLSVSQSCALVQALSNAEQRESMVKDKIVALQDVFEKIGKATENSWQSIIDEERLLNKIQALEAQLAATAENNNSAEIKRLINEKEVYEKLAKESLSKVLQEKLTALRKVDELQFLLKTTQDNVYKAQETNQLLSTQVKDLAEKVDSMTEEASSLTETHSQEKAALSLEISDLQKELQTLQHNVSTLEEELEKARRKHESPISEKGLIIENAVSEAEDKISLDSSQGETKSNKEEVIRLEEIVNQLKDNQTKLESEKEELLDNMSDYKRTLDRVQSDLDGKKELSIQLQMFQRENARLEVELTKAKAAPSQQLEDLKRENFLLREKLADATSPSLRQRRSSPDAEKLKQIRSLQIELSDVKERFQKCQDEKLEMRREFDDLAKEYNGFARQLSTACRNSMIPLFLIIVAAILVSRPFSEVFGRSP